ncbi:unnamed protein product, partial [Vitis vinifera]
MATYFHGSSEIQADGLQTLYLMNPNYIGYSDTQQPSAANMLFLNATPNSLNPTNLPNMSLQNQHFVGIPLPNMGSANSDDQNRSSLHAQPEMSSLQGIVPRFHYNLWGSTDQNPTGNQPQIPTAVAAASSGASAVSNGISGMQSVLLGSKYLKAAQQLLDEVANVGKGIKTDSGEETKEREKVNTISVAASTGEALSGGESSAKRGAELSTAQRQELQMKKAKLVNMLDEVEQRYRQYHQQMQIVVSSFEQAAGQGSAKSYTALALQTISKQFRCLKDAISAQIKATSSSLGEEDCSGGKVEGSRLRFVDHQLRQQRALQQLGMIQHNAWRPQRGLPERAVSVLRAWLFEHFLHPYPKDSDKHMLAKQTGLTRSQVSNWFINARVRLWKPMVEEMYLEEIKDQEHNEKSTTQNASPAELSNSTMSTSPMGGSLQVQAGFNLIGSSEIEGMVQRSPKKPRSYDIQSSPSSILSMDMEMKPAINNGGGFGAYSPIGDIGRFNPEQLAPRFHGNSVSLTLGLPHCENLSLLEMGNGEPDYCGINAAQPSHSNAAYDSINIQNRKRFAAQLLPDFVA